MLVLVSTQAEIAKGKQESRKKHEQLMQVVTMCVIRLFKYESFSSHAHLQFLQSDDKLRRMLKAAKEEHAKVRVYLQIFRMPILLQWLSAKTVQALNGVQSESTKLSERLTEVVSQTWSLSVFVLLHTLPLPLVLPQSDSKLRELANEMKDQEKLDQVVFRTVFVL